MKRPEYPTPEELDFFPVHAIHADQFRQWSEPWEHDMTHKKHLKDKEQGLVCEFGRAPLPTEFGDFTYIVFGDRTNHAHHELLIYGNLAEGAIGDGEDLLVRLHSACRTNEVYHAVNCECRKEIHEAMTQIAKEGRGIIVYLEQEGRGTGIAGKMAQLDGMFGWQDGKIVQKVDENGVRVDTDKAYKDAGYPSECRDFDVAGEMLHHIGVKSVRLLTNNPLKVKGLKNAGIKVKPVEIHIKPDNEIIASDLKSKALNLGHSIAEKDWSVQT